MKICSKNLTDLEEAVMKFDNHLILKKIRWKISSMRFFHLILHEFCQTKNSINFEKHENLRQFP